VRVSTYCGQFIVARIWARDLHLYHIGLRFPGVAQRENRWKYHEMRIARCRVVLSLCENNFIYARVLNEIGRRQLALS
jgi:hypothetical protein